MSMTVIATRNVQPKVRGFLASVMLEVGPGVYCAPRISPAVRDRIWSVMNDWFTIDGEASVVMLWHDNATVGGQAVRTLGCPPVEIVDHDGMLLARRRAHPPNS